MKTTITIDKNVKDILDEISIKSESYNDIIKRLVETYFSLERETVRKKAEKLVQLYSLSTDPKDKAHALILQDVAKGESLSWETLKKELL